MTSMWERTDRAAMGSVCLSLAYSVAWAVIMGQVKVLFFSLPPLPPFFCFFFFLLPFFFFFFFGQVNEVGFV